ncbi:MAG: HAMP domain-containing histidine kinase [Lachnospiraceae bacterium]|nr:HAMP domain-containing histidine kinase [Lachnospiraceae bacterium]
MKQIRRLAYIFMVFMLSALAVFTVISKKTAYKERDIVDFNDRLYRVEADLQAGLSPEEIEARYGCVLILSGQANPPELAPYYRSGALVLDLEQDGEIIGKVVWNDLDEHLNRTEDTYLRAAGILCAAVLICGCLLLLYLYLTFLKPVEELESFAADIAKGELDKPLPLRKDNLFGRFVEGFDIMREQLKASIRKEREAEIARKELIQGLSHDIKTPLAVIRATCEVMEVKLTRCLSAAAGAADATDAEIRDMIDKIRTISGKADTISTLMSDVMHANLEDLEKIEIAPCEEQSTLIEEFFKNLKDYGNIILDDHIYPCLVYMDRKRMEQVIDNIVSNSAKYAGTDIHVSFSEVSDMHRADGSPIRFVRVTIRDEGPGVSKEDLPLLAEKYYRGGNSAGRTGYGLGMYLARTYMEKQEGGLEFYNDNGFVVELLVKIV